MAPVYSGKNGVNIESLQGFFECDSETAAEILDLCEAGYAWGLEGYWPEGDYSSDADWCYGPGESIQKIELRLDIDDGSVFDKFQEAHSTGLSEREESEDTTEAR